MKAKKFKKVQVGDIGFDYNGDQCIITATGTIKDIFHEEDRHELVSQMHYLETDPAVQVKMHGELIEYVYGFDGVYVKKEKK